MGRVYRARHRATGALRALKVIEGQLDQLTLARFEREAQALARVGGQGIVGIHETGRAGERLYFVMDLMPGGSLRDRIERQGRLPWPEAARLLARIARAVDRCHAAGLVHRDLKPENVLFDELGEPRV